MTDGWKRILSPFTRRKKSKAWNKRKIYAGKKKTKLCFQSPFEVNEKPHV